MPTEYYVPQPDSKIFQHSYHDTIGQVVNEKKVLLLIDHVEYPDDGGIYIYYMGIKHPRKGFPTPESVASINIVKKISIGFLNAFSPRQLALPLIGFFLSFNKKKIIQRFLDSWLSVADWILHPYYLKPERYCTSAIEIKKFVETFATNLGLNNAHKLAEVVGTIIEYDDSYRYRIQDLAGETDKLRLSANPQAEFKKILGIYERREKFDIAYKFNTIGRLARYLFFLPKVKRAWRDALQTIDLSRVALDEADRYHTLMNNGYDFDGRTIDDRKQEYLAIHKDGLPMQLVAN